jgi:hypothetical protein
MADEGDTSNSAKRKKPATLPSVLIVLVLLDFLPMVLVVMVFVLIVVSEVDHRILTKIRRSPGYAGEAPAV